MGRAGHFSAVLIIIATSFLYSLLSTVPAQAEFVVSDLAPRQGETIEITFRPDSASTLNTGIIPGAVKFNGHSIKLFPEGVTAQQSTAATKDTTAPTTYSCLIAIPADLNPGRYKVLCGQESISLKVGSGNFPLQRIYLPPSRNNFNMSPGEQEAMKKAKDTLSPQRFWNTEFIPPSNARMSSVFGVRRMVNGKVLNDYFHTGVDYAASAGSPVRATAPGTVVLAHTGFKLHGNVVIIDHGQGVVSVYIHLQKVLVQTGQHVQSGEVIGKVGQTGRANGPHLHFGLYVNDVATNPVVWYHHSF